MGCDCCDKLKHEHNRVSKKDRFLMLLMVLILAAIFLRPFVVMQNMNRGDSFLNYGFYNRAILQYRKAALLSPNEDSAYSWLGYTYNKIGYKDKAMASYEKAIEIDPTDNTVNFELGNIYYRNYLDGDGEGFYEKAIKCFEGILENDPSNKNAKLMLDRLNRKSRVKGNG